MLILFYQKTNFSKNNKIVFNACDDYHLDYFDAAEKILGAKNFPSFLYQSSYVIEDLLWNYA